jgi:hypothetical protein
LKNNRNAKLCIAVAACLGLFGSACGSSPQSLIVGKWEAQSAVKVTAEFGADGTAKITMLGHTLQGTYKFNADNELVWTVNGVTTTMKIHVTANELEVTDGANQTLKYKRK